MEGQLLRRGSRNDLTFSPFFPERACTLVLGLVHAQMLT